VPLVVQLLHDCTRWLVAVWKVLEPQPTQEPGLVADGPLKKVPASHRAQGRHEVLRWLLELW
jgi:hypothetical protein